MGYQIDVVAESVRYRTAPPLAGLTRRPPVSTAEVLQD
jgi:hypothetical protein